MDNQKEFYTGSTFAFDATIALAEAFHLAEEKGVVDFDTYKYKNHATTFMIGQLLLDTSFEGVTVGCFYWLNRIRNLFWRCYGKLLRLPEFIWFFDKNQVLFYASPLKGYTRDDKLAGKKFCDFREILVSYTNPVVYYFLHHYMF